MSLSFKLELDKKRVKKNNKFCLIHGLNRPHFYKEVIICKRADFGDWTEDDILIPKNRNDTEKAIKEGYKYCRCQNNYYKYLDVIKKEKNNKKRLINNMCQNIDYKLFEGKAKRKKELFTKEENCAICLDSMKNRNVKTLGCCKHSFCQNCFESLIKIKDDDFFSTKYKYGFYSAYNLDVTCPLCRENIFKVQNNFEPYPEEEFDFENNNVDEYEI